MTELDRACEQAHYLPDPVVPIGPWEPPVRVPAAAAALAAEKAITAARRARRLGLAVAALSGAVVALGFAWAVDRG